MEVIRHLDNMDTPWDSLANLNLSGNSSQTQPSDSIQQSASPISPQPQVNQTQSSDPWSDIVNSNPISDTNVSTAQSSEGRQDLNGYCEEFVEDATYGKNGMFPTADAAWNNYVKNGQAYQGDVTKAPAGSLIYFAPDRSNNNEGHTGVSDGEGNMISATDNGVQQSNVAQWMQQTGQQPLGYVEP